MAKFCKDCGNPIKDDAKFCPGCGKPTEQPTVHTPKCVKCGAELKEDSKFCPICGAPVSAPDKKRQKTEQPVKKAAHQAQVQATDAARSAASSLSSKATEAAKERLSGLTEQLAFSQPGEAVLGAFGDVSGAIGQAGEILSPIKTVINGIKSFGQSFIGMFKGKDKKRLIIAAVIAVVWIVLMILSYSGVNIGILNWLTFAQGGAGRSVFGWLGGLLGKTTVAAMLFSLLSGGYKSLGSGFKSLFSGESFKPNNLGSLLIGAGGSLIVYQFFAGKTSWTDMMPAISGALLSVQALGGGSGFLYRMAQSLTSKVAGKSRIAQNEKITGLLSGVTYGFTLGAAVSVIPFGWLPVILGGACVIAGIVLSIVFRNKKEVAAV